MKTLLSTLVAVLVAGQALALGDGVWHRETNGDWVAYKTANFTHANSATEKYMTFDSLPAYLFNSNGYRHITIKAYGHVRAAADATLDVNVNMGGTPHETVQHTFGGTTNGIQFVVEAHGTIRSSGSGGTVIWSLVTGSADPSSTPMTEGKIANATDTLDTTTGQMPSISLDWGAASGLNSATLFQAEARVSR